MERPSGISDAVKKLDAKNDKIRRYVIDCSTIPKSATSPG
jgi:hypothetical protein